jgi:hypothetical protein
MNETKTPEDLLSLIQEDGIEIVDLKIYGLSRALAAFLGSRKQSPMPLKLSRLLKRALLN